MSRNVNLRANMEDNMAKARDAMMALKEKVASVKARISEETQTRMLSVKDITERNRTQQDINKMTQQDRMRMSQDRARDMNQRIKDQVLRR